MTKIVMSTFTKRNLLTYYFCSTVENLSSFSLVYEVIKPEPDKFEQIARLANRG